MSEEQIGPIAGSKRLGEADSQGAEPATVSVIVPSHNRRDSLPGVLEPVLSDAATSEVVVVLDGSTDGSAEWVRKRARDESRLRLVVIDNAGSGTARAIGADTATGDVLVFLDDDVVPAHDLIHGHRARHQDAAEEVIVLGSMPIRASGQILDSWIVERYRAHYQRHQREWLVNPESILSGFWAGNFSITRTAVELMGGLEPGVRMGYHQDLVCGLRAQDAGLRGVYAPELVAEHRYERDLAGLCRDSFHKGFDRVWLRLMFPARFGPLAPAGLVGRPPLTSRRYGLAALPPSRSLLSPLLKVLVRRAASRGATKRRSSLFAHLERIETAAGIRAGLRAARRTHPQRTA